MEFVDPRLSPLKVEFDTWYNNNTELHKYNLDEDTKEWMFLGFIGGMTLQVQKSSKEFKEVSNQIGRLFR